MESIFTDSVLDGMTSGSAAIGDYDQARQGAALWRPTTTLRSFSAPVTVAGANTVNGETLVDGNYTKPGEPVVTIVSRLVNLVQGYYSQISLSNLALTTTDAELQAVANSTWATLGASPTAVLESVGAILTNDTSELVFQELRGFTAPDGFANIMDQGALIATEQASLAFEYTVRRLSSPIQLATYTS
ncbi:MAG: hypothetical protein R2867_31910 [Caldilineaceae bacterium]